jgi:hypothetical protein
MQGWLISKPLDPHTFILPRMFSNLRSLWLTDCSIQDGTFVASLRQCTQLTVLGLVECHMLPSAATRLSSLCVLSALQCLSWHQPKYQTSAEVDATLGALAQLTQLTSLTLGYSKHATNKPAVSTLMTVPSKMHRLQAFEIDFEPRSRDAAQKSRDAISLESNPVWDRLGSADLQHLLTRHTILTTLSLDSVVLDQAGLDLLLAHPHIVHVTLLAIAATESRAHTPCSWQTLKLAKQADIRTVAHVPLHSLKQPLAISTLLLPPDVRTEQLPDLLHKAAAQLAADWKQVAVDTPGAIYIDDLLYTLRHTVTYSKRVWTPDILQALFQALAPLAACADITGEGTTIR